ncbi:hypothetical protein [Flavihumibacter sp. ZG627]|uniref:hypothetical protein n=1 Tax=Flavihumibacter sp. ZG627 TaxID=1463156 RepID=UPI000AF77F47|nr:hypothetical protein [Flavihumibacter sp. ZG627]
MSYTSSLAKPLSKLSGDRKLLVDLTQHHGVDVLAAAPGLVESGSQVVIPILKA